MYYCLWIYSTYAGISKLFSTSCSRFNSAYRCRLTVAFLPTIFHQVLRGLSTAVDLFLGITPSLSGCLSTFIGVEANLYGPIDVTEYFQYASIRAPDTIFTGEARKSYMGCMSVSRHRQLLANICYCTCRNFPRRAVYSLYLYHPLLDKYKPSEELSTTVNTATDESQGQPQCGGATLAGMVRTVGLSSSLINPQTLVDAWLHPNSLVSTFYNRPEATSLLSLLGPWLFEAAVSGSRSGRESRTSAKEGKFTSNTMYFL